MVDRSNRERGLKAAIHNPRVSEQAKQRDREILETEFGEHFEEGPTRHMHTQQPLSSDEESEEYMESPSPPPRVKQTSGLQSSVGQSTSKSSSSGMTDKISSSTKAKVRRASAGAMGAGSASHGDSIEGKDTGNVIRGLKAAISNPNVSEKAKERDRQRLRELGEAVD